MDVLKNERMKAYNKLSRYQIVPYYYNTLDSKYMHGTAFQLDPTTNYQLYKIKRGDTLDILALQAYNNPCLFWVIADFNRIQDPFIQLPVGYTLKIPSISDIEFRSF